VRKEEGKGKMNRHDLGCLFKSSPKTESTMNWKELQCLYAWTNQPGSLFRNYQTEIVTISFCLSFGFLCKSFCVWSLSFPMSMNSRTETRVSLMDPERESRASIFYLFNMFEWFFIFEDKMIYKQQKREDFGGNCYSQPYDNILKVTSSLCLRWKAWQKK
jgi:hypothetical protein